jgi:hypothetical protein
MSVTIGRSFARQQTLFAPETEAGVPETTGFKAWGAIKTMPGWDGESEPFNGGSSKFATTANPVDESQAISVEMTPDFNHLGYPAASRLCLPVTTTPSGGTLSRQHVFDVEPDVEDSRRTYTLLYGDEYMSMEIAYAIFNSLTMDIQRGQVAFGSNMIGRTGDFTTDALPAYTSVAEVPIPSILWDIYADDTWAGLGTTQLLAAYQGNIALEDKFEKDAPIDSSIVSFKSLLEAADQTNAFDLVVGLDSAAVTLQNSFKAGAKKFFRMEVEGPIIELAIRYKVTVDFGVIILGRGEISAAPNSPVVSIPLRCAIARDSISGKAFKLTLINTITSY